MRLGTRQSPLAVAQAEEARARLCAAHGWHRDEVELVKVVASGDKIQDRPLAEIGGKALWTKELDQWLVEGRIDAAVHSMKDVETFRPDGFAIAAILPRADRRDVLVGAESVAAIPHGATVGTSAPRRAAQMLHQRPDLKVVTFRGNVATRLGKLEAGEADVTLLAAAGLERLGESGIGTPLEVCDWLPAPSQGAIGIECVEANSLAFQAIAALDDEASRREVEHERALLRHLRGTCHSPIGVDCRFADGAMTMRAAIYSSDGYERIEGEARFPAIDESGAAGLARDLLSRASLKVKALFDGEA